MGKEEKMLKKFVQFLKKEKSLNFVSDLIRAFPKAGIFLVGGIVRDIVLGRKSKDFDFMVAKIKAKDLEKFLSRKGKVDLVGKSFGVFKFLPKNIKLEEPIDIALPRTEFSTGEGGYRDFSIQSDPNLRIEDDLSRRDFTINALAFDIKNKILIDLFNGLADLKRGIVKTVGDPKERFREDYSRILRGIRFSCQLGFKIEEKTFEAMKRQAPNIFKKIEIEGERISIVPYETISKEFLKSLDANPNKVLDLYDQLGILKKILPEIEALKGVEQPEVFHSEGDVYVHTKLALKKLRKNDPLELKLAVLLHDIGKPPTIKTPEKDHTDRIRFDGHDSQGAQMAKKIGRRLRLKKELVDHIYWLIKHHLLFLTSDVYKMRSATIKKYFIDDPEKGKNLLELFRIDNEASLGEEQKESLRKYRKARAYVEKMRKSFEKTKTESFSHVIDGYDIIKTFKVKPGPEVGKYLEKAQKFILKYITKKKKEPTKKEVLEYLRKY